MKTKFIQNLYSSAGVSIVQVLFLSAALGALSVVISKQLKTQNAVQQKLNSDIEMDTLKWELEQIFLDDQSCRQSFASIGDIRLLNASSTISSIKNRNGDIVFETNKKYANDFLLIKSLNIKNATSTAIGPTGVGTGSFELEVDVERAKADAIGVKNKLISIPIKVELDTGYLVTQCFSEEEDAIETSKEKICQYVGGTYIVNEDRCSLQPYASGFTANANQAVSNKFFNDYMVDNTNGLDSFYINVTGDTLTGNLTVNQDISANRIVAQNMVCVSGRCRTFNQVNCTTADEFLSGINADGSVTCLSDLNSYNKSCGSRLLQGFDASGNPICGP